MCIRNTKWEEASRWEKEWHGNCVNSYAEETKQLTYATRMGLVVERDERNNPVINFHNKRVVDIGGGPYSILLKGINKAGTVVDPCLWPTWVLSRYASAGINFVNQKAEEYTRGYYEIGIIYNCLQHTEEPERIIKNMRQMCKEIFIHEWLDTPKSSGHIQTITEFQLNKWLGGYGTIGHERWSPEIITPYYAGKFIGGLH